MESESLCCEACCNKSYALTLKYIFRWILSQAIINCYANYVDPEQGFQHGKEINHISTTFLIKAHFADIFLRVVIYQATQHVITAMR